MDKAALVKREIEKGKKLIEALDTTDEFQVKAAMWLYLTDSEEWRLLIASPFVEENGSKKAYHLIRSKLESFAESERISIIDISVLKPNDPLVKTIKSAVVTGPGITGIRFSHNVINGTFIEDAYIYRMLKD